VTGPVVMDVAAGPVGGAASCCAELYRDVHRIGRNEIKIIGDDRQVSPAWLVYREATWPGQYSVGFVEPGDERSTLIHRRFSRHPHAPGTSWWTAA
jgi:hypothetical protein